MTSAAHHDHLLLKQWMVWGNFHIKRKGLLVVPLRDQKNGFGVTLGHSTLQSPQWKLLWYFLKILGY